MRPHVRFSFPVTLLLVASCSPSKTASTPTAGEKPKGVLEFRVLAMKQDPDAYKFSDYREALTQRGELALPDETGYRWFAIKEPADFFKSKNLKDDFDAIRGSRQEIVERRGEDYYVLAHTAGDYVMTHAPGAPAWSVKNAEVFRSTRGYAGIGVELDDAGGALLERLSQTHQGKQMGMFLDDRAIMHATIMDAVGKRISIHGAFSASEAEEVVKLLQNKATPQ